MGVFVFLLSVGFVAPIFVVGNAVEAVGWRGAWQGIGLFLLFGLVPLGLLFARSSPETCGVTPDETRRRGGTSWVNDTLVGALHPVVLGLHPPPRPSSTWSFSALYARQ